MKETNIQKLVHLASAKFATMFRNNTGMGWVGKIVKKWTLKTPTGETDTFITIKNPRPLHAGLCEGSSDLIGWRSVVITPEMVGKRIAIFTALEVKTETGKPSQEQTNFIRVLNNSGGIAAIVKSENEVLDIFKNSY